MELRLKPMALPEAIEFNFNELKAEIELRVKDYKGVVYSDSQIKDAKKDLANLRRFTKALSDERIRVKREIMKPYDEFERKVKDLSAIAEEAISDIDSQVKAFAEHEKAEKKKLIESIFSELNTFEWLKLEQIYNDKWLNSSSKEDSIREDMAERLKKVQSDIDTIACMEAYSFEAMEEYKLSLNIYRAINEGKRLADIQKRKEEDFKRREEERLAMEQRLAEQEAERQRYEAEKQAKEAEQNVAGTIPADFMNPPVMPIIEEEEQRSWVTFSAYMTEEEAKELKQFFKYRNIKIRRESIR